MKPTRMPTQPTLSIALPPFAFSGTSMWTFSCWVVATLKSKFGLGSLAMLSKRVWPVPSWSFQFTSPRMGWAQIIRRYSWPLKKVRSTSASSPGASWAALKVSLNLYGSMLAAHLFLTNERHWAEATAGRVARANSAMELRRCFIGWLS